MSLQASLWALTHFNPLLARRHVLVRTDNHEAAFISQKEALEGVPHYPLFESALSATQQQFAHIHLMGPTRAQQ